jgi:hypothetical protein
VGASEALIHTAILPPPTGVSRGISTGLENGRLIVADAPLTQLNVFGAGSQYIAGAVVI